MGDTARPIPERLGDQDEQAAHLVRTGNGPTVDDEEQLLAEAYGAPDMAGFYTGPEVAVDQDDEPEAAVDEPADEGTAPAADTAEGGESA
ncbi:hypothetical protein [Streptomyces mirabilis]|uniref:hypothetical protein n=1 Tax=Streptomyces mirabilis TaxID=68239 RepID=UPI002257C8CB|nr:hypothetical protein [Streptomyces mirabilis]MCX4606999.1 hypothetical protein [Streptomyces mirabilis]